jgi:nitrogen fixation protein NifQ
VAAPRRHLTMSDVHNIPADRLDEYQQLLELLMDNCATADDATLVHAGWIARSALEPGHLWRSMGLESRDELRRMFYEFFPGLYAANDKDMRWKKFLYRRMCGWSGFSA